jgi:eukaryotic-like serine/threonine-protein kinase
MSGVLNPQNSSLCERCHHPLLLVEYLFSQTLFQNRYRIVDKLGTGGSGSVYKASDTQHANKLVAIKEICLSGLSPQALIEATNAFYREADLLSQLNHSNLPHLYERYFNDQQWYLVLDFIDGETLEDYQSKKANQRLVIDEVFKIGLQLCTVLEYLHAHQPPIVFRDLKPSNIILTPERKVYLIDFGIARFFKPGQSKDTMALGSLGYAAPEQYGKAQTTPRADIYALGAVMHQMLTGKDPSEAPLYFSTLNGTHSSNHSDPGALTSSMVDIMMNNLGILINSMVERDITKRPPSATHVKQELQYLNTTWSEIVASYFRPRTP